MGEEGREQYNLHETKINFSKIVLPLIEDVSCRKYYSVCGMLTLCKSTGKIKAVFDLVR